jgi:hypothetical protein
MFSHCSMGAAPVEPDFGFSKPSMEIGLIAHLSRRVRHNDVISDA